MQFHKKKICIYLISVFFCLGFFRFSGPLLEGAPVIDNFETLPLQIGSFLWPLKVKSHFCDWILEKLIIPILKVLISNFQLTRPACLKNTSFFSNQTINKNVLLCKVQFCNHINIILQKFQIDIWLYFGYISVFKLRYT